MRYAKGSLSLNRKEDKFVLEFVADSRYVTRSQLFEFARLEYGEYNRPVFNWRIRRMVEVGLLRKHAVPIAGGDVLYSINRAGVQALERLGTYYLGAHLERDREADQFQIPHSLELNEIRLALLRTCFLVQWIPESFSSFISPSRTATSPARVFPSAMSSCWCRSICASQSRKSISSYASRTLRSTFARTCSSRAC